MSRADCFPEFFATACDGGYLVFRSEFNQCYESLNLPANILTPVGHPSEDASLGYLKKSAPSSDKYTVARKWNGKHYRTCTWMETDKKLEFYMAGKLHVIPVVCIKNCFDNTIPFNPYVMKAKSGVKYASIQMAPRFPVSALMPIVKA
jgi:hypothetical protein